MKTENTVKTFYATIHIGGDINVARQIIRDFCMRGACVQLMQADYVYTGAVESGIIARFIQYPLFPKPEHEIISDAMELADMLLTNLCQRSCSIETPYNTTVYKNAAYSRDKRD